METTAVRRRLTWQAAAVTSIARETASVVTIELEPPDWPGHLAGQHLDVRLTAGPIGGYFVWEPTDDSPLMLIAGGSGVVPLRSMLRHRLRAGSDVPARLLYSSRTLPDVIYRGELDQYGDGVRVICTLTRSQPPGWTGYSGRVNTAMLAETVWPASQHPLAFVCGPTTFVEAVAENLIGLGYPSERIKTERFGGT